MDVESLDSGRFETIILAQIASRTNFLVILESGTLEGCQNPKDWVRREIEYALERGRNIVPILVNNFCFDSNADVYLTGRLCELREYNGLELYSAYFDAAMERLRTCFLRRSTQEKITPPLPQGEPIIRHKPEQTGPLPLLYYPYGAGTLATKLSSLHPIEHVGAIDTRLFSKDKVPRLTSDFQEDMSPENLEPSLATERLPHLSEAARELLLEAVQDDQGLIMRMSAHDGMDVKTHGRSFVEPGNARSAALWRGAVNELHNLGLVEDREGKGEFFFVTNPGYHASDLLKPI